MSQLSVTLRFFTRIRKVARVVGKCNFISNLSSKNRWKIGYRYNYRLLRGILKDADHIKNIQSIDSLLSDFQLVSSVYNL